MFYAQIGKVQDVLCFTRKQNNLQNNLIDGVCKLLYAVIGKVTVQDVLCLNQKNCERLFE